MKKVTYHISGMHCRSCEVLLEERISKVPGVRRVTVHHLKGTAEIEFSDAPVQDELIEKAVRDAGYALGAGGNPPFFTRNAMDYFELSLGLAALLFLYILAKLTGIAGGFGAAFSAAPTYPAVFVIGLVAGVSTCMALVGGLVAGFSASYAAVHQSATRWERFRPNLYFNAGRLASFAVLGGALGAFGSVFQLSSNATGFLAAAAGVVMLYLGLKLTGISPRLSRWSIALPKRFARAAGSGNTDGAYSHAGSLIGGALTFFLPCGFTQAMQLYAMTTGSFASGAIVMFLFALGTLPGLLGVGALSSALSGRTARLFFRFVGIVVVLLGLASVANGYRLTGAVLPSFTRAASGNAAPSGAPAAVVVGGEQVVQMDQLANGYQPNRFTVKKGIPVQWVIDSREPWSCASSIRVPAFNIFRRLTEGQNVITFTPTQTGSLRFTCAMGMYSGVFDVVD